MPDILTVLQHTPTWVFALFGVLLVLGLQSLKPRTVAVWRVLIVPAVFIAWGLYGLAVRSSISPELPWFWVGAACVAAVGSWLVTNLDSMRPEPAYGRVHLEASAFPLVRNMVLFFAKYCIGIAIAYAIVDRQALYPFDVAISGLSAGYFAGWLARFAQRYRSAASLPRLVTPTGAD